MEQAAVEVTVLPANCQRFVAPRPAVLQEANVINELTAVLGRLQRHGAELVNLGRRDQATRLGVHALPFQSLKRQRRFNVAVAKSCFERRTDGDEIEVHGAATVGLLSQAGEDLVEMEWADRSEEHTSE